MGQFDESSHRSQIGVLQAGSLVGGTELRKMIARDEFSSIWLTEPLEEGFGETCVRVIPASNLRLLDARRRFRSELDLWQSIDNPAVVNLYDHGWDHGYYYMLLRYMPEGSLEDMLERGRDFSSGIMAFALQFAEALRELHGSIGAHGHLKPSNVFPYGGEGVRVGDFLIPLWIDEVEEESPLLSHIMHAYRAPEQHVDYHRYDTRSDIYSFGLIVLRCLSGEAPTLDGLPPKGYTAHWPGDMAQVMQVCLNTDHNERYADGYELYEALRSVCGIGPEETDHGESPALDQTDIDDVAAAARAKMDEGDLEGAIAILESLPEAAEDLHEMLDEIEQQQVEAHQVSEEAVRLAGMGNVEAALETIDEAHRMWSKSNTIIAIRSELEAMARGDETATSTGVTEALRNAITGGNFDLARPLLEKALRSGPMTPQLGKAVRDFKHGRVRKSFLDNLTEAHRLFALGHTADAAERWTEASRWLPSGPERERLRKIASIALGGRLQVNLAEMSDESEERRRTVVEVDNAPALTPELQAKLDAIAGVGERDHERRHAISRGCLAGISIIIGALIALIFLLIGEIGGCNDGVPRPANALTNDAPADS